MNANASPVACLLRAPRQDAALRLFCFHHAGGGASFFSSWGDRLPPWVDVLPVQLPGRETRRREPRFQDLATVTEVLGRELAPWMEEPHAVYGHSMGGLVAHELVAARIRSGLRAPLAMYAGASAAPHLMPQMPSPEKHSDQDVARFLVDMGGLDPRFLEREDWLRALLPVLRDDLRICHSPRQAADGSGATPLPLTLEVFTGADDTVVTADSVQGWESYAQGFTLKTVPGGHFFPREAPDPFFEGLNASLESLMASRPGMAR